jgi:hypothetical protein
MTQRILCYGSMAVAQRSPRSAANDPQKRHARPRRDLQSAKPGPVRTKNRKDNREEDKRAEKRLRVTYVTKAESPISADNSILDLKYHYFRHSKDAMKVLRARCRKL